GSSAGLFNSVAADFANGALPGAARSANRRRNPRTRTAGHHRIERSVSSRLEGDRVWQIGTRAGRSFLSFAFSGGVFAQCFEAAWSSRGKIADGGGAALCAQDV